MSDEKAYLKPIGKRLIDVRERLGFKNREQFAAAFGVPKKTFEKYEQGLSELPTKLLLWLREDHHVNLSWLLSGDGEPIGDLPQAEPQPVKVPVYVDPAAFERIVEKLDEVSEKVDEVREVSRPRGRRSLDFERPPATIKWYPVPLSAGGGSASPYDSPGADLNLEEFASELLGIPAASVRVFRIRGDSMLPTLVDGDVVIIDSRATFPDDGEVYAFSIDGETYAKRAEWLEANKLLWKSDNEDPRYATFEVSGEQLKEMRMIGRVVWVWKPV